MARWSVVLAAAALLSACNLLSGIIPDITVSDAFGLNGVAVSLEADVGEVSALTAPVGSTVVEGVVSATFPLDGDDDVPAWVNAKSVTGGVGLGTSVTMTHDGLDSLAASYEIVGARLNVTVREGTSLKFTLSASVDDLSLVLTRGDCEIVPAIAGPTCAYSLADVKLLDLAISGSAARAYSDMLRAGGTYTVTGTLELTIEPGIPLDTTVDVELKAFPGLITF